MLAISSCASTASPCTKRLWHTNPWPRIKFSGPRQRMEIRSIPESDCSASFFYLAVISLQAKGDRASRMAFFWSKYIPFLDDDVFDFLAKLHPRCASAVSG